MDTPCVSSPLPQSKNPLNQCQPQPTLSCQESFVHLAEHIMFPKSHLIFDFDRCMLGQTEKVFLFSLSFQAPLEHCRLIIGSAKLTVTEGGSHFQEFTVRTRCTDTHGTDLLDITTEKKKTMFSHVLSSHRTAVLLHCHPPVHSSLEMHSCTNRLVNYMSCELWYVERYRGCKTISSLSKS